MIVCGIATVPPREEALKQVLSAIAPQVDNIYLALNGYIETPAWIKETHGNKIITFENPTNHKGDAMKFAFADMPNSYFLSLDDDLVVPPDYAANICTNIDKYDGLVSLHGRHYPKGAGFKQWDASYRCLGNVKDDVQVNFVGSGCAGFHTSRLKLNIDMFETANKADCYLSREAYNQGVPMWVLAHKSDYLTYMPPKDKTIWETTRDYMLHDRILKSYLK
jgi:hypothetical protein